jgi:hypothetical protein
VSPTPKPRLLALALLLLAPLPARAADRVLAEGSRSDYHIVVGAQAGPPVRHAAEELQRFLREMTGATLAIATDDHAPAGPAIVVGPSKRLDALSVKLDAGRLGLEGYALRTVGPDVILAGPGPRGTPYAVYGLLEDHLGCRWFASEASRIPKADRLVLPDLDETVIPRLEYREPFTFEAFDGDWAARNRMNSTRANLQARHGGKVRFGDGFFVHTFSTLVPPEKHFKEHPEYFSLVKGKRQDGYAQLCCTNEDVIRICTEGILAAMRAQPEATVFSVSQNDTFKYCECDRCAAMAKAEGSQIAPVLALVNRVAEAAAREFPGKAIETLAYQWTRTPPKSMRPLPNVIIRLCSIECCFAHPLDGCDSKENRAFVADLKGWSKVSDRLWVWDYVTNFGHYLMPFPNQRVRDDNIRLYLANSVTGIFEQDTYDTPRSELAELGAYLTAKSLWNPVYGEERATAEFLDAYYGAAAGPIRAYLDRLHDHAEAANVHVHIFDAPSPALFPPDLLAGADALWGEAEAAVASNPDRLRRVKLGRMSVDYALTERARKESPGSPVRALARTRLAPYLETLRSSGLTHLREGRPLDFPAYRDALTRDLGGTP